MITAAVHGLEAVVTAIPACEAWAFVERLGLPLDRCQSLTINPHTIEATVLALDERGKCFEGERGQVAVHHLSIRLAH